MFVSRLRLLAVAAAGVTTIFAAVPAAQAAAGQRGTGRAACPAANDKVALPPAVTAPQVAPSCPAAPYGTFSYAPGTGKTVALTFDDGPGASTSGILSVLGSNAVPATFFNIGQNMGKPAQPCPIPHRRSETS